MGMTSTMTTTASALQQTPSCIHLPSESSACAQLRADYQLAAGAFLRKDFARTHALVHAALARIPPGAGADAYAVHRRQWAVLRNTLLATVHGAGDKDLPPALRDAAALPGPALAEEMRTACAHLFAGRPPAPVAHTLAVAALRLGAPGAARDAVEAWLAHRADEDGEGSAKLVEVYVLHVLPRLGEWEYAHEFLAYEREMPAERREVGALCLVRRELCLHSYQAMKAELAAAHAKHLAQTSTPAPSVPPSPTISSGRSRSPSPAPSTTSSQTARPARQPASALTPVSPTARGRAPRRHQARPTTIPERGSEHTSPALPPPSSAAFALAGLRRYLRNAPGLAALCVLVALLALVRRVRGTRAVLGLWREVVRAVGDTVSMAGRGLV
jgi:hypothetical protein